MDTKFWFWAMVVVGGSYALWMLWNELQDDKQLDAYIRSRGMDPDNMPWDRKDFIASMLLCAALTLSAMWPMFKHWL